MQTIKNQMFGTRLLKSCMLFLEYEDMYIMMKPDFTKIELQDNKEEIEDSIFAYQERARFNIAEYYFLQNVGLVDQIEDITDYTLNFKNYAGELRKKMKQSFYSDKPYTFYSLSKKSDTLSDRFLHRILTIQNLLGYYANNTKDKYMKNEIANFHTLGMVIMNYFFDYDVFRYMELASEYGTIEKYNELELFQQLSDFANFYLAETDEYDELYNRIMDEKNGNKSFTKKLTPPKHTGNK